MNARILTANRLGDGAVVYRDAAGNWVEDIADAEIARDEYAEKVLTEAGARALAARLVVGPYLMEITEDAGTPRPVSQRERIRAAGPTVGYGEAKKD